MIKGGKALVKFETKEGLNAALKLNGVFLKNSKIIIESRSTVKFREKQHYYPTPVSLSPSKTLFVYNLRYDLSE
jgi:hypothetical protein